jgi:hypothetical protein
MYLHKDKNYLIIGDTLYCRGVDNILNHFLTHEEVESFLNECHNGVVVVIYLGLEQPKKNCKLVIFGRQILNIVLKRSRSVTLTTCFLEK